MEKYDSMEINNIFAFEEAKRLLHQEHENYGKALNNLAVVYSIKKEDDLKALELYKSVYDLMDKENPVYETKATLEENIAFVYLQLGDFETAKNYFLFSIDSWQKVKVNGKLEIPYPRLSKAYEKTANLFLSIKEYEKAKEYISKSLKSLLLANKIDQNYQTRIILNASKIDIALTHYDTAIAQLADLENKFQLKPLQKLNAHHLKGLAFFKKGNLKEAITHFRSALCQPIDSEKVRDKAVIYQSLARVYFSEKKYLKALKNQQLAVQLLAPNDKLFDDLDSPKSTSLVNGKLELFRTLVQKGNTLQKLYESTTDEIYLSAALQNYLYLAQLTNDIRSFYQSNESQLLLLDEAKDFYEAAITTSFLLFEKNKSPEYLEHAFFFSEKSKSELLLEELRKKEFSEKGIIADRLLKLQYDLKTAINYNRKILKKEKQKTTDKSDTKIKQIENTLFDLQKELADLKDQINSKYPTYATLTKLSPSSIKEVQANLNDEQILLEYFVGEKNIFLFKITSSKVDLIKLENDFNLDESLAKLFQKIKVKGNDGIAEYAKVAHDLFLNLLPPKKIILDKKNITIIPDGQLENLPFDILLTKNDSSNSLRKLPYLINDFLTSYAYSATIFSHQKDQNAVEEATTIGLFPTFEDSRRNLQNNDKIYQSLQRFSGTFLKNKKASIQNLLQDIQKHQVIHFSTHARGKDSVQNEPSIDLADGSLLLSDLQTYNLSASLAVLSACETNVGTYRKGEGIMSLSRGFTFAGVPSIITSTSNVLESSTLTIIDSLYKNLEQKMPKHEALQQAKLAYLANPNIPISDCTPYHWGSFLAIGNTDPITFEYASPKNNWWYFLGVPVVLILFFIFKKLKSN